MPEFLVEYTYTTSPKLKETDLKMTKQEFVEKHRLSDAKVIDPLYHLMILSSVARGLEEFLGANFAGAAKVSSRVNSGKCVLICTEYFSMFFKQLLADIYGRVFLKIHIEAAEGSAVISISSDETIPLTFEESRALIKLARNAGMEIYPEEKEIRLTIEYTDAGLHSIYAISASHSIRTMLAKLNEIFYCGEPMTLTPKESKKKR